MSDTILSLLKEARRDWITDERWEGDQYGGCMVPTGEALRAFGARLDKMIAEIEFHDKMVKAPTDVRSMRSVQYDCQAYQRLRDLGDLRSWACDQLHEDLKFVLGRL